jgi:hypothetical protein
LLFDFCPGKEHQFLGNEKMMIFSRFMVPDCTKKNDRDAAQSRPKVVPAEQVAERAQMDSSGINGIDLQEHPRMC